MRVTIYTLILSFIFLNASAQERISGLVSNPKVKSASADYSVNRQIQQVLTLPFFDDFSNTGSVFPDPAHWTDNYVFINDHYSINPPTIGVATFDAIDNYGRLFTNASPFPFGADTLSSVQIRLDSIFVPNLKKISRADSLYFSFYYQPQGNGNSPAKNDSLILEFLAPDEAITIIIPADTVVTGNDTIFIPADTTIYENWVRVWSSEGLNISSFYNEDSVWFKQVFIPVLDSARFYKPDFRFRFTNYASLADAILPDWQSNGDQWNVDYIYLNTERSVLDKGSPDVAFSSIESNFLRNYTSMPYNQYRKDFINETAQNLSTKILNLDEDTPYNALYRYEVKNPQGDIIKDYSGGNFTISPFITDGYVTHPAFAQPSVGFFFPSGEYDQIIYSINHILTTEANLDLRVNDTLTHKQIFSNYLSYDDGTAEAGYGITPTGAQVAYRFKLNESDSLFGVNMFFNQTLTQGNVHSFYLNVWNDNFGEPGDLIYSRFGYVPVFEDSLNKFFYYELDSSIMIESNKFPNHIFYVGWEQASDNVLNLGYDRNSNASTKTFWKTSNGWNTSLFSGALMIRPVIGKERIVALEDDKILSQFSIYPNPALGTIVRLKSSISTSNFSEYKISISSSEGRVVAVIPLTREVSISGLSNGFYIVRLMNKSRIIGAEKLIINH